MSWLVSGFRNVLQLKKQTNKKKLHKTKTRTAQPCSMYRIALINIELTLLVLGTRTYHAVFSQLSKKLNLQFCKQVTL